MRSHLLFLVAACGQSSFDLPTTDSPMTGDGANADSDGLVSLDNTPTTYHETCDGSGVVALSFTHFVDVNDENQGARIYQRAMPTAPVQTLDLSAALGVAANAEVDLEDVERIGSRIFITASHGRTSSGALKRERYKFAAFDVGGTAPSFTLTTAGTSNQLLDQMLVAANWNAPDATVIAALAASSKLGDNSDATLAPEVAGTNIEALANDGTGNLLIGFRNPRPGNKAIVISLVNPDAALTGTARFGGVAELDLGGLGIRGMTYSPTHDAVLVIAGPHDGASSPFKLYKWSGALTDAPTFVTDLSGADGSPEAVVAYPNTKDVQIVFDGGDAMVNGTTCKTAAAADRVFHDAIVTVD